MHHVIKHPHDASSIVDMHPSIKHQQDASSYQTLISRMLHLIKHLIKLQLLNKPFLRCMSVSASASASACACACACVSMFLHIYVCIPATIYVFLFLFSGPWPLPLEVCCRISTVCCCPKRFLRAARALKKTRRRLRLRSSLLLPEVIGHFEYVHGVVKWSMGSKLD